MPRKSSAPSRPKTWGSTNRSARMANRPGGLFVRPLLKQAGQQLRTRIYRKRQDHVMQEGAGLEPMPLRPCEDRAKHCSTRTRLDAPQEHRVIATNRPIPKPALRPIIADRQPAVFRLRAKPSRCRLPNPSSTPTVLPARPWRERYPYRSHPGGTHGREESRRRCDLLDCSRQDQSHWPENLALSPTRAVDRIELRLVAVYARSACASIPVWAES